MNTILSAVSLSLLSTCLFGCNIQKSNNDAPLEKEEQTWTFGDSFESGDVSKWDITVIPTAAVVANNAYMGSQAFRGTYTFGQPTDNRLEKYFGDHPQVGIGNPVEEIWIRSSHMFSSDFTFSESAGVQKVWIINYEDDNGDRVDQLILNVIPSIQEWRLEWIYWTDDGRQFTESSWIEQTATPRVLVTPGEYQEIKVRLAISSPNKEDGTVQMWIDGELVLDQQNIRTRIGSEHPNQFLLVNYNTETDIEGSRFDDDIVVSTSDPRNSSELGL